ncbi:MAG TPA: hypothetical protein VHC21_01375 [Candidatus Saccharimonadales bacterium]|nr:hypothetical protein [Candidatus Saccharimonadales bacterium]
MSPELTLGAIVVIPAAVLMVLRINAALVFLSLCLGNVLVQFVASDASTWLTTFSSSHGEVTVAATHNNIKIALLLLPAVLTAIFMVRTVSGTPKLVLNILPAVGVGLLAGLLVVPLLASNLSHNIIASSLWWNAQQAENVIIAGSAIVCLVILWMQRPKSGGGKAKGHGHKA